MRPLEYYPSTLPLVVSLLLAGLVWVVPPVSATILVPADQPTIQAGLDAASNGEMVIVAPGTYFESELDFQGKDIVLVSSAGPAQTVIDGNRNGPIFTLTTGESRAAVIEGFTITDGLGTENFEGGGILVMGGASPTIRGNRIVGNEALFAGGGIKVTSGGNPLIEDNLITGNTASEQGGGVHVFQAAATIQGNTFRDNEVTGGPGASSPGGGAVKATLSTDILVVNNLIDQNFAPFTGGGISIFGSDAEIVGNEITANGAANGGGIHLESQVANGGDRTFEVRDNLIDGNIATQNGGGIHSFMEGTASPVIIHGNTIQGNSCVESSCSDVAGSGCCKGGGISALGGIPVGHDVRDNRIIGNQGDLYGAAIFDDAAAFPNSMHLVFEANWVEDNQARFNYPGLACVETASCQVLRNTFAGNRTVPEPADPNVLRNPGALYLKGNQDAKVENSFFFENHGSQAGAVLLVDGAAVTTFLHNTFAGNLTASAGGGTLRVESDVHFRSNIFSGDHHAVRVNSDPSLAFFTNDFHGQTDGIVIGGPTHSTVSSLNGESYASGNLAVIPGFLSPTADEYWLAPESALLGAAPCGAAPPVDVDGDPRPIGSGCDIGADEHHVETEGLYNPATSTFYLRAIHQAGAADATFRYGPLGAGWRPLAGDWNGNRVVTAGLYDPSRSRFHLRNLNSGGTADLAYSFGPAGAGWTPIVGDWNGDGIDTIGLYKPTESRFFLRNSHGGGAADVDFRYGPTSSGWHPVAADWDGDGIDTVGLYDPARGIFFLRNANAGGAADLSFRYGPSGSNWAPVVGDWDGDGVDTIGLYDPSRSWFLLRNENSAGGADIVVSFGPSGSGWHPLTGRWGL